MPVPWTGAKAEAEARYNVTTDFPSLGLHAACASNNLGGVEFALARGQPVNSALDGVLPIHVAASSGSEKVVKLLLEHGADVNALRLPRRYSNDKNRDASVIIGASNSTPLHFAAANGHIAVVHLLLQHGAHADRPDKHGVTPEMVARQNGHDDCAQELRSWARNRDKDLLEREALPEPEEPTSSRRRLHKRSGDNALKGSSTEALRQPVPSTSNSPPTPPASPMRPFGEYTFYPTSTNPSPIDPNTRRPSLPQISYPTPPPVNRKASLASRANPRRPRSAGNGAEQDPAPLAKGGSTGRKLGSKYSLLGMFKKDQIGEDGATAGGSSSSVTPSADSSPGQSSTHLPDPPSPFARRPSNLSPSLKTQPLPVPPKSPSRPPMAVDLHNAFALHQQRERAGSGTGTPFEPTAFMNGESGSPGSQGSHSRLHMLRPGHVRDRSGSRSSSNKADDELGRPGILRAHNRSISGPAPPAVRALRFDPNADASGRRTDGTSNAGLRSSTSAGSLSRLRNAIGDEEREAPDSAPAAVSDFDLDALEKNFLEDDDEDEYAYGRPLPNSRLAIIAARQQVSVPLQSAGLPFSIREPPPLASPGHMTVDARGRGASVSSTSTTDSQANPQLSSGGTTSGSASVAVLTPLQPTESLPAQNSPAPAQAHLETDDGDAATLEPPTATPSRLTERRTPTPLDIDLSLISSHAQAEALVKKELKDILDMPTLSPADTKTPGWTPLSARLAAYGESLELERKLRPETKPTSPIEEEPAKTATSRPEETPPRNSIGRQNSLEVRSSPRRRRKEPRRPHTSSGTDTPSTESAPTHHPAQSTSSLSLAADARPVPISAKTAATATEVVQANNRVRRARTPDPEAGLSRVNSLDIESIDTELGPALTRVSTAPMPTQQSKRDLARHIASANKLTRMGFQPVPPPKPDPGQPKRFGGLKSLMQTFKGKS
ncbi:hypothetical protein HMN09_01032300 [Mycena chlorophos]|uniref:Ankyrin n=1 Tax=Mycena chlorophos TaxID=658473 RepID=A0A8H6VXW3_MYCCL|nr:hypothetical protein HMN09_01032300 [Mycena chlorophos]